MKILLKLITKNLMKTQEQIDLVFLLNNLTNNNIIPLLKVDVTKINIITFCSNQQQRIMVGLLEGRNKSFSNQYIDRKQMSVLHQIQQLIRT